MTDREKLIELLDIIIQPGPKTLGDIADYLIANGVTFATDAGEVPCEVLQFGGVNMNLSDLVGEHILSGIEVGTIEIDDYFGLDISNYIKFTIDGVTLLATEDPEDGYRSYMRDLVIVEEPCKIKLPNIRVCCTMCPDGELYKNEVLSFVDVLSGKEILAVGTANTDDYYPYCILEYTPENMFCNIKEAATDNNVPSKWIPVTERLPEEKGSYLTARRRDVFVEQWNGVLFSERCHHSQPTHWMPLPEPPEGD